jgi:hypothetical protein
VSSEILCLPLQLNTNWALGGLAAPFYLEKGLTGSLFLRQKKDLSKNGFFMRGMEKVRPTGYLRPRSLRLRNLRTLSLFLPKPLLRRPGEKA